MTHWKGHLGRIAFSLIWIGVLTALGGFLGAIAGAVVELALRALWGGGAPLEVIPLIMLVGSGWAFLWALREAIAHRQVGQEVPSRVA